MNFNVEEKLWRHGKKRDTMGTAIAVLAQANLSQYEKERDHAMPMILLTGILFSYYLIPVIFTLLGVIIFATSAFGILSAWFIHGIAIWCKNKN